MTDLDAIKARLDAARFGPHADATGSELLTAWADMLDHAPDDLDALVTECAALRETVEAVREFAADWECIATRNREAFRRGQIGHIKDTPSLDRLRTIINGGAA